MGTILLKNIKVDGKVSDILVDEGIIKAIAPSGSERIEIGRAHV